MEPGFRTHKRFIMPFQEGIADWEWDEYDEILGFDDVPTGFEDYEVHVQAHLDRCVRGIPTQMKPQDLEAFRDRARRRTGSRIARGISH
eukprot:4106394-Heterocapsa_arctica.AAC.1